MTETLKCFKCGHGIAYNNKNWAYCNGCPKYYRLTECKIVAKDGGLCIKEQLFPGLFRWFRKKH